MKTMEMMKSQLKVGDRIRITMDIEITYHKGHEFTIVGSGPEGRLDIVDEDGDKITNTRLFMQECFERI